jgi:hypothetical protein
MRPRIAVVAIFAISAAVAIGGCQIGRRCPQTIAEAQAITWDDEIVAGGYAIRFIPSPDDPAYRGYDVNITLPISERAQPNTLLLRVDAPIPGIANGMPVLLLAERPPGAGTTMEPGLCPALTQVAEEELAP